jgi:hypothetical protein
VRKSVFFSWLSFYYVSVILCRYLCAPRWNAAIDAPASSYSDKQRWSIVKRIPTQSIGTIKSEQLLTTAKRAVKLAIETNEQTALNFITDSIISGIQTKV